MARLLQRWPYEAEPSATGHSQSLYIVHRSVAISTSSIIRDSFDIGNRAINSALLQLIHQTFLLKVVRKSSHETIFCMRRIMDTWVVYLHWRFNQDTSLGGIGKSLLTLIDKMLHCFVVLIELRV